MIAAVHGKVLAQSDDAITVWCSDIAYEIRVPRGKVSLHGIHGETSVLVHTWHIIRDDDQFLLGFDSRADRDLAIAIGGADKVGPATASRLVWGAGSDSILAALRTGDAGVIPKVTGVGPTSITNILAHLKKSGFSAGEDDRVAKAIQLHRAINGSISPEQIAKIEACAREYPKHLAQQLQQLALSR